MPRVAAIVVLLALSGARSAPRPTFSEFAVASPKPFVTAKPDVRSGDARRYRTVLREGAKKAPDFAGHFKIVRWGCGTCCSEFAILNLKTGHAFFPGFIVACEYPFDFTRPGVAFEYRVNSRLLVIAGAPNEADGGVRYYEWTGARLRLLRRVRPTPPRPAAPSPPAAPAPCTPRQPACGTARVLRCRGRSPASARCPRTRSVSDRA